MGSRTGQAAPPGSEAELNREELNSRILDAWSQGDDPLLAGLYAAAGQLMLDSGLVDEGCFFLTQAYILALENGLGSAPTIHAELVRLGREE